MQAKWIVEHFTDDNGYEDLIEAVLASGRKCQVLNIKNHFQFDAGLYTENECVIFQGSIQLAQKIKEYIPTCRPVVWLSDVNYLCSRYYAYLSEFVFNDMCLWTTVKQLKEKKFFYYSLLGKEAVLFVRPDDGNKSFKGQLLDLQDFDRFWDNKVSCVANPEDLVFISTPKRIFGEWRFVVSKEIITYSTYMFQGQIVKIPSAPQGAIDKCNEILQAGYRPDPVFCIDIAEDADRNYWLLELNSFSSAGLYACNKTKIVEAVSKIAEEEYAK